MIPADSGRRGAARLSVLVWLALAGCTDSHLALESDGGTRDDAGLVDAGYGDAGYEDGGGPDAGRVEPYELLVVSEEGAALRVHEVEVSPSWTDATTPAVVARVPLRDGDHFGGITPLASSGFAVLNTYALSEAGVSRFGVHLLDLSSGGSFEALARIDEQYPDAGCVDTAPLALRALPRHDGVIVTCTAGYPRWTRTGVYRVDPSGAVLELGTGCDSAALLTPDGRVMLSRRAECDRSPEAFDLVDPWTGAATRWPGIDGETERPIYWDSRHGVPLVAEWDDTREVRRLWRVDAEGERSLVRDSFPPQVLLMALSEDGRMVAVDRTTDGMRPNVRGITVHDVYSERETTMMLPPAGCASMQATPDAAHWSGANLLITCGGEAWIFDERGARLDLERLDHSGAAFSSSRDGSAILRDSVDAGGERDIARVDPSTGRAYVLPAALEALDPISIRFREARYAQCGMGPC